MGASQASRKSRVASPPLGRGRGWALKYSIHSTEHVPPYITKCVHLSMNCTSLSGVSGKNGKSDSTQMSKKHTMERGYFLIN